MNKIRVSGSALTVETPVQYQASPCEIYGGQSDTDRLFSEYFGFFPPITIIPPELYTHSLSTADTILLTYLLTPGSRVLLEKLTGFAANQEIPCILGTRKFITIHTSARHLSLS